MSLAEFDLSTTLIGLFLGIGLAASAGFRVFLPLFALSLAIHFNIGDYLGMGTLSESFSWVGSTAALVILGVATLVEIFSYYIPFVDNLLDTIAVPLAGIAGTVLVASQLTDAPEVITWTLALIAGGGTAAAISGTTAATRAVSSTTTAGTGNFLVSTAEIGSSVFMSIMAFILPVIAFILAVIILFSTYLMYRRVRRRKAKMKEANNS